MPGTCEFQGADGRAYQSADHGRPLQIPFEALGQLGRRRLTPAVCLTKIPLDHFELPDLIGQLDGKTNEATAIGDGSRDPLAHPPHRVGREPHAPVRIELLRRAQERRRPLLHEIEEIQVRPVPVPSGDGQHQAHMCQNQAALGREAFLDRSDDLWRLDQLAARDRLLDATRLSDLPGELNFFFRCEQRTSGNVGQAGSQEIAADRSICPGFFALRKAIVRECLVFLLVEGDRYAFLAQPLVQRQAFFLAERALFDRPFHAVVGNLPMPAHLVVKQRADRSLYLFHH